MDVLTISSAQGGAALAVVRDGEVIASAALDGPYGLAAALPGSVADLLDGRAAPALIAAVIGPGSFTGLRAGLALAHGLALGFGVPVQGVGVAEALSLAAAPLLDGRCLWVALEARAGQVFLDHDGVMASWPVAALPAADGRIAVAGDAAKLVAAGLAAQGADVKLLPHRAPAPADIATVALARWRGERTPAPSLPVYVEPALARRSPAGRGAPVA